MSVPAPGAVKPRRNWLLTLGSLIPALMTLALVLGLAWVQARIEQQLAAMDTHRLDRTLLAHLRMHAGRHELGATLGDDPAEQVLLPHGLQQLRSMPGVADLAGLEFRHIEIETGAPDARRRIKLQVAAVPAGFFAAAAIGDAARAEAALQAGHALMPQTLQQSERIDLKTPAEFLLEAVNLGMPAPGSSGFVAAQARLERLEAHLLALPLNLPAGMSGLERTVFISTDHPLRRSMSMTLPQYALWIRLADQADAKHSTRLLRDYLHHEAPRVVQNAHLELQNLGEFLAGPLDLTTLQRYKRLLLGASMAGLLTLHLALLFLNWGALRRELALRQALGQSPALAVWQSCRSSMVRVAVSSVLALVLAASIAMQQWALPMPALAVLVMGVLGMAMMGLLVLPLSAAWASRQPPMPVLMEGTR